MSLSVSAASPKRPAARARWDSGSLRLVFAGFVLALVHIPLLLLFARDLWGREHYRFFPFLLPGAFALAYARLAVPALFRRARRIAFLLFGLAWIVLAIAILLISPWLGAVAALLTVLAYVYWLGGSTLVRCLFPAWCLLCLAIPLPDALDAMLVAWLRRATTVLASQVLELLSIFHFRDGNVIDVAGRPVFVEEACSGIHSLFSVLACTFFWAFLQPRPRWHRLALMVSVVPWVLAGNVARVVVVAAFGQSTGVDFGKGWCTSAGFAVFGALGPDVEHRSPAGSS